jgi:hypothetical protein
VLGKGVIIGRPAVQKRFAQKAPQGFLEFSLFAGVDAARGS